MIKRVLLFAVPALAMIGALVQAAPPMLEVLGPKEEKLAVTRDVINVLGKAEGVKSVKINGKDVEVFATSKLFALDKIALTPGLNTIEIAAKNAEGEVTKKIEVTYTPTEEKPQPNVAALAGIDEKSVEPAQNLCMVAGDIVAVTFRGKSGMKAQFKTPADTWMTMTEAPGARSALNGSLYKGAFVVGGAASAAAAVEVKATDADGKEFAAKSAGTLEVLDPQEVYMLRVRNDGEALLFGIHEVRLSGPNMADLPAGTLLRATGKVGTNYRVLLAPGKEAWIAASGVEDALGEVPPHGYFTSMAVTPNDKGDTVSLSWKKQPFTVRETVNGSGNAEVLVDLFGAHDAATWVTHRSDLKAVKRIWTEQLDSETLRIHIELQTPIMWGYEVVTTETSLQIGVKKAPKINAAQPLKGLTIAVEAGHGGKANVGARGVSGSEEQFVNMNTSRDLEKELLAKGAKVVQLRVDDENPGLGERARRAKAAGADMLITIHANSGGGGQYFGAAGLSNYYKYGFCAPLTNAIHKHILDQTEFEDWGVIGNFNYGPIRITTSMPSMLVEQAFMSNVKDEAMLLDPKVRAQIAKGIRLGMEEYLRDIAAQQKKDTAK